MNYLKELEKDSNLKIMDWPFQSPDLNPIEKLWDHLADRLENGIFGIFGKFCKPNELILKVKYWKI